MDKAAVTYVNAGMGCSLALKKNCQITRPQLSQTNGLTPILEH